MAPHGCMVLVTVMAANKRNQAVTGTGLSTRSGDTVGYDLSMDGLS